MTMAEALDRKDQQEQTWVETTREHLLAANAVHVYGSIRRPFWAGVGGRIREEGVEFLGYRNEAGYADALATQGPLPTELIEAWQLDLIRRES